MKTLDTYHSHLTLSFFRLLLLKYLAPLPSLFKTILLRCNWHIINGTYYKYTLQYLDVHRHPWSHHHSWDHKQPLKKNGSSSHRSITGCMLPSSASFLQTRLLWVLQLLDRSNYGNRSWKPTGQRANYFSLLSLLSLIVHYQNSAGLLQMNVLDTEINR